MTSAFIQTIATDLSIYEIYHLFRNEKNVMLLESQMEHQREGRYSILGIDPFKVLQGDLQGHILNGAPHAGSVFEALRRELQSGAPSSSEKDLPFTGGAMGFISYDLGLELEKVASCTPPLGSLPPAYFVFFDNFVIFDHDRGMKYFCSLGQKKPACESFSGFMKTLDRAEEPPAQGEGSPAAPAADPISNFTRDTYLKAIEKIRGHIENGDTYIANLTRQIMSLTRRSADEIFALLRQRNPAPFAALLKLEDGHEIISSSPERFLCVRNRTMETRPIKGTLPRGKTVPEDEKNAQQLMASDKDRAELLMIVDLERNDLSKVCKPFSVKVPELYKLEKYATVMHLVATVTGELSPGRDAIDAFLACFPGGSITGAPKRRSMEIIDQIERKRRGLYTGCIGYFGFDGNIDTSIVIRTIVKRGDEVSIGVGGGITWESIAENEYQETIDKAVALLGVL
jgi:para-aminobenzoate synthetase component 1